MKPLEEVFEEAREISKSMCNAYLLGLRNEAIEFVPRHEYDRDAWCMGNEKYTKGDRE